MTENTSIPLETKKANQVLLKVTKMRNKKTGQFAYRVHKVKQVDYEFEAEALADFAFATGSQTETNRDQTVCEAIRNET